MATIEKRGGVYRVKVRRKGYPPVTASFDTKLQAEQFARTVEHQMDEKKYRVALRGTVGELFSRYGVEVSPTKKGCRWEQIRLRRLERELGEVTLQEVQKDALWLRKWRDSRLRDVQGSSVNRELNLISSVFSHAIKEWGFNLTNPVAQVKRPANNKHRNARMGDTFVKDILTRTNFDESKSPVTAKDYTPWVFLVAIETAMRTGELLELLWENVRLDESWCFLPDTKNEDSRYVPLTPRAVELLQKLPRKNDRVFPVNPGTFGVYWRRVRPKGYRFHDTRHEATTRLAGKLSNVLELAAVTGHRDLRSLKVYFNPTVQELAAKISGVAPVASVSPHVTPTTPVPSTATTTPASSPVNESGVAGGAAQPKG